MVTCGQYQICFDETTLAGLNNCLNGGTHGPVHIKLGGEWNNPEEELASELGGLLTIRVLCVLCVVVSLCVRVLWYVKTRRCVPIPGVFEPPRNAR